MVVGLVVRWKDSLALLRVRNVARVANRSLDKAPRAARSLDAQLQVVDVVERVEHAENVHAGLLGLIEGGGWEVRVRETQLQVVDGASVP